MKQEQTNKKYVPYGINGMYFVYDNEVGQIPVNYGTKGANKATIQRMCNDLNAKETPTDKQVNAFTSGKWEANIDHSREAGNYPKTRVTSNGKLIAECYKRGWIIEQEEAEANAALIASAPALKAENEKLKEALLLARKRFYLLDKKDKTFTAGMAIDSINEILNETKQD